MTNSQVIKETVEAFKIDTNVSAIPNAIPVIEVGVKSVKNGLSFSSTLVNATSTTLFTFPSDRDTYLTGAMITFVRDALATSELFAITYVPAEDTANRTIVNYAGVTLTAGNGSATTPQFHPIKVKRGSVVTITSTTNTGNFKVTGLIYFFYDDVV